MRSFYISCLLFQLTFTISFGQHTEKEILYFTFGKDELTADSKAALESLAEKLENKTINEINLAGHTDSDGSVRYNLRLSKARLSVVHLYLTSNGISKEIIKTAYYGKSQPLAPNDTEEGKAKNRRVEITIDYTLENSSPKKNRSFISKNKAISADKPPCDNAIYDLTEKEVLHFNMGIHKLSGSSKDKINKVLDKLEVKNIVQIELSGYTDSDGNDNFNLILAQKRVNIVQKYLISKGISSNGISGYYYGKINPIASNDTPEGKEKNRRVEMVIRYNDCPDEILNKQNNSAKNKNSSGGDISHKTKDHNNNAPPNNIYPIEKTRFIDIQLENNDEQKNNTFQSNNNINLTDSGKNDFVTIDTEEVNNMSLGEKRQEVSQISTPILASNEIDNFAIYYQPTKIKVTGVVILEEKDSPIENFTSANIDIDADVIKNDIETIPTAKENEFDNSLVSSTNQSHNFATYYQPTKIKITNGIIVEEKDSPIENSANSISDINLAKNSIETSIVSEESPESYPSLLSFNATEGKKTDHQDNTANTSAEIKSSTIENSIELPNADIPKNDIETPLITEDKPGIDLPLPASNDPQKRVADLQPTKADTINRITVQKISSPEERLVDTTNDKNVTKQAPSYRDETSSSAINIVEKNNDLEADAVSFFNIDVKVELSEETPTRNTMTESSENNKKEMDPIIASPNNDLQIFTVPAGQDFTIKGTQGTTITLSKNSLVDIKGELITNDVVVELQEVYTKSDMLNNNIQTICNQKLLESGGMINLNITSNNSEPVFLKDNATYKVEFPTSSKKESMDIFYATYTENGMEWKLSDIDFGRDSAYYENQRMLDKYVFNSSKLGWINCDRFVGIKNRSNLRINLDGYNDVNVCLVFKRFNSVVNVNKKKEGMVFLDVPVGETATLVAFSKKGDEILFASRTIIIDFDKIETLKLEKLTEEEFQKRIKEFNN